MPKCFRSISTLTVALVGLGYSSLEPAYAEEFNCFQTGGCALPIQSSATQQCLEMQSTKTPLLNESAHNDVIVSAHTSHLERNDGYPFYGLDVLDDWNRYDFSDHGVVIKIAAVCS